RAVASRASDHHGSHGRRKAEEGKWGARYAWRRNGRHGRYGLLSPPSTEMKGPGFLPGFSFLCRSRYGQKTEQPSSIRRGVKEGSPRSPVLANSPNVILSLNPLSPSQELPARSS